ncbi:hypothetical protein I7I53_05012 [Histoplasma capsulatum var. duboisii H88]|uniref:Uncharacterized protein n=1 Tax=Ajellomyces capsulatus (strain H88) TaxID=544711 RepID=A0A8A1LS29_AJEC8|nr:hypothetical protein I7I53_05012 [Histoplasma capsulatum var. duboisii H88]
MSMRTRIRILSAPEGMESVPPGLRYRRSWKEKIRLETGDIWCRPPWSWKQGKSRREERSGKI